MKETAGTTGLIFNEPLLWEKGKTGRTAFSSGTFLSIPGCIRWARAP